MERISLFLTLTMLVIFSGCKVKDKDKTGPASNPVPVPQHGVFIINEGSFTNSNGSVSLIEENGTVKVDLFKEVNGRPLGDVVQSMAVHQDKAYIVVNNSGKIEVVDKNNFTSKGVINGVDFPRYMLVLNYQNALVSELYTDKLSVVDLKTNTVVNKIPLFGWTEEMILAGEKVFVTNQETRYVYIIQDLKLVDSIEVGLESNSIVKDKNGKVWVLTAGGAGKEKPSLTRINAESNKVELTIPFGTVQDDPSRLRINAAGDQLYLLNGEVWKMDITSGSFPSQPFIQKGNNNWYGLGVDPFSEKIYVSDAVDFQQRGYVYRYNATNGQKIDSLLVGIIPVNMHFF